MTASAQQSRTFIPVKAGKAPHLYEKHLALIGISLSVKYTSVFGRTDCYAGWGQKWGRQRKHIFAFHLAGFHLYKVCDESVYSVIPIVFAYPCCISVGKHDNSAQWLRGEFTFLHRILRDQKSKKLWFVSWYLIFQGPRNIKFIFEYQKL